MAIYDVALVTLAIEELLGVVCAGNYFRSRLEICFCHFHGFN